MFKKLRNKFILTNMITTSVILAIAFGAIFGVTALSNHNRPPEMQNRPDVTSEWRNAMREEIEKDRTRRIERLGITLIMVAIATELITMSQKLTVRRRIRKKKSGNAKGRATRKH